MATNEPDVEMDHEYDQIVFTQNNPKHQIRESQSNTEFAASTPQGVSLYPQLPRQLLHENDWGKHLVYKMQVLQEQEKAIAGMNIPPVDLLKQVQGGDVYSTHTPIKSYEDAVMATAFMPGMFIDAEAIPEFKPRICEKMVLPVKKVETHKNSSTDSETEQNQTARKVVLKYGKKRNLIDCQNPCSIGSKCSRKILVKVWYIHFQNQSASMLQGCLKSRWKL